MSDLWQHRWENFVDLLTQYLQAGEESDALLARIAGKRVVWTGHLENTDLDELAPNVYINLPSRVIEFGDGRKATVDGISLPIAQGSQSAWASVQPGAQVKFQAIIGRGESPFPPVSVKTFKTGKTMVTIRLVDGVPVS